MSSPDVVHVRHLVVADVRRLELAHRAVLEAPALERQARELELSAALAAVVRRWSPPPKPLRLDALARELLGMPEEVVG
ncbi:hypothetical protein [Anaeromyxobacter paludicola]|uniref:Uncharacterized protein n=1 Tax=Anaeromyxobacter paludicola TaxID=2918171 RepID=A0ABM7X705_9BACT|nr:hypothetical protein [Anaeromyxobacter paludicola]BDG07617.1 hypothetical protein AMPC_07300 [Anaeromyxobacter paludicola]